MATRPVDGFDSDGTVDTVAVTTNATGGGTVSLAVAVNVSVTYPAVAAKYAVDARTVDSTRANATATNVATITAAADESTRLRNVSDRQPTITDFRLNATEQDVDVVVSSTEDLEKLKVKVKGKVKNVTLTRADFTETLRPPENRSRFVYNQNVDVYLNNTTTGNVGKIKVKVKSKVKKIAFAAANATDTRRRYVYRADISEGRNGQFRAQLVQASSAGQNASVGHRDELTVHTARGGPIVVFVAGLTAGAAAAGLAGLALWRTV